MRYIGIDYGTKKIGIALSDEQGYLAYPHEVIDTNDQALTYICDLVRQHECPALVVGESKDFSMKDNVVMVEAREFILHLQNAISCPVVFEPEFLTSFQAHATNFALGGKQQRVDASAAAIILQSFLDRKRNQETL